MIDKRRMRVNKFYWLPTFGRLVLFVALALSQLLECCQSCKVCFKYDNGIKLTTLSSSLEVSTPVLWRFTEAPKFSPIPLVSTSLDASNSDKLKLAMKASIIWYKDNLSPILPPRCRFLPTCSSYGLEAIETYGPWKGGILTAWRIFRCNPFGGSGYDPPVWPPPNYFAGSSTGKFFWLQTWQIQLIEFNIFDQGD